MPDLKRLSLAEERELGLLPIPSDKSPEYGFNFPKDDPLFNKLVAYQERFQSLSNTISLQTTRALLQGRHINKRFQEVTKWNDNYLPTMGLAALASAGAWKTSPMGSFIPFRLVASLTAISLTSLICLPEARVTVVSKLKTTLPPTLLSTLHEIDTGFGESGARIWERIDSASESLKTRIKSKINRV